MSALHHAPWCAQLGQPTIVTTASLLIVGLRISRCAACGAVAVSRKGKP